MLCLRYCYLTSELTLCYAMLAFLVSHQRRQTGPDLMLCYACVKTFRQLLGMLALLLLLQSHQQGHTGTDPILCYTCAYDGVKALFSYLSYLTNEATRD